MKIKFKRDTALRKQFFVPESFAHPAKMDAQLLIWIVEHYTEADETILDPMAGMGTTMLACTLGRDVVLVELEGKFCKMMRDNWEQVKMRPQLGSTMGECQIIQGDARDLINALMETITYEQFKKGERAQVDKIITSPPYAQGIHPTGENSAEVEKIRPQDYVEHCQARLVDGYGKNPNNIGNLPYGEIDKCIFSPPFGEAMSGGGIARYGHFSDPELAQRAYSAENMNIKKQIKRVEEGKAKMKRPDVFTSEGNKAAKGFFEGNYSRDPKNIGNLPYGQIDKIVTSPPYEEGGGHGGHPTKVSIEKRQSSMGQSTENLYSSRKDNIGNFKGDSYLEAMLQVYQQCHKVLKPQGLMILVTKNFIRNKQVVRLDEDTIKLCEQAGFGFVERHYRKLPSLSFWRVTYAKKYPDLKHLIKQLWYEDILVFKK